MVAGMMRFNTSLQLLVPPAPLVPPALLVWSGETVRRRLVELVSLPMRFPKSEELGLIEVNRAS
jgi:hypothetical protein